MRMWCAKPVGATHHGRLHNAQATEWREGRDRPGRGHPDLAGIYQPGNMTIDARRDLDKLLGRWKGYFDKLLNEENNRFDPDGVPNDGLT